MVTKVYTMICTLFAVATAALLVSGNFTMMVAVVMGFIAFGVVFMGMMFVIPFTATHPTPSKAAIPPAKPAAVPSPVRSRTDSVYPGLARPVR